MYLDGRLGCAFYHAILLMKSLHNHNNIFARLDSNQPFYRKVYLADQLFSLFGCNTHL